MARLLTVLLVFNGLCPYVGLKTGSSFAMYSNLHTEGGICNHLFMPCGAIRIAHFQDDLVEILDSSQPDLRDAIAQPWRLTYFEFRRLLAELEREAAAAGATTVRLETNAALTEAIALYRSSGYGEVPAFNDEPYAHHWFEKEL